MNRGCGCACLHRPPRPRGPAGCPRTFRQVSRQVRPCPGPDPGWPATRELQGVLPAPGTRGTHVTAASFGVPLGVTVPVGARGASGAHSGMTRAGAGGLLAPGGPPSHCHLQEQDITLRLETSPAASGQRLCPGVSHPEVKAPGEPCADRRRGGPPVSVAAWAHRAGPDHQQPQPLLPRGCHTWSPPPTAG